MKKNKKNSVVPLILKVDKKLDKYLETDAFRDKLDKANELLRTSIFPPGILQ
jgi:hypothetical protein